MEKIKETIELSKIWEPVTKKYNILKFISKKIVRAEHKRSKKIVAIKLVEEIYKNFKNIVREIQILNSLAKMKGNIYT